MDPGLSPEDHSTRMPASHFAGDKTVFMSATPSAPADVPLKLADAAALATEEVLSRLASSLGGLSSDEAALRLGRIGPNALAVHRVHAMSVLFRQIRNPILILLLGAALVSGLTGGATNAIIIAVIVVLSVGLGFFNEYRAEVAMASLRGKIRHDAEVTRDGRVRLVPVVDLVPGDVVSLRIGNVVPADLRLLTVDELECDEGVLTGESLPCTKSVMAVTDRQSPDQPGCAFMGTMVHQGSALGVVVCSGSRTAFGEIASGLTEKQSQTAFEVGLSRFSRFLFGVAGVLTLFIFAINVALSRPLIDALLFSLAIAVGIAPEMMPAIVTVSLSAGSKALVAKNVLVKRLVAIEDLGNIQILFTDKTGTLTDGAITFDRSLAPAGAPSDAPLVFGLVCNESVRGHDGPVGGNALDQALWGDKRSSDPSLLSQQPSAYTRVARLPFDHDRQLASVLVDGPDGRILVTKGAPEAVLAQCTTPAPAAGSTLDGLFHEGARVVAVATRPATMDHLARADECNLNLVGFLTFVDRPKADAGTALARLRDLGIEVKIITGDNR